MADKRPMKVYRVGGSVRDELLGRPVADRDWVVVGATPQALVDLGYRPVGRDFPVFLHPESNEEYALARTERKRGTGYRGFAIDASPEVTLEEDLRRRDLTINAMARGAAGNLIDPFGGATDLAAGVLRHVSDAFAEDPLRVLRVARFAARYGFGVAPETEALLRRLAASGELDTLSPERVWQELSRGLMESRPSRMLGVLRECGALAVLLPEVDALYGVPLAVQARPEQDAGVHVARALDYAAQRECPLAVRYAVLAHGLGNGGTDASSWPIRKASAARNVRLADKMSRRLKVPAECRDAARLAGRWYGAVDAAQTLSPAKLLELFAQCDAYRRPERLDTLIATCECVALPQSDYAPRAILRDAFAVVRAVRLSEIARTAAEGGEQSGDDIAAAIRAARLGALRAVRKARPPAGFRGPGS